MKYTRTEIHPGIIADAAAHSDAHSARAPGWHVTTLIREAYRIAGHPPPEYADGDELGLAAMGRLWEGCVRAYLSTLPEFVFIADVTLELDGVTGSLDGPLFDIIGGGYVVQETKLKFSALKEPQDYPLEMHQVKAYCKMLGTRRALMLVASMTSKPPKLTVERRDLEFTQEEIDETWVMIRNTKKFLEKKGVLPS